MSSENDYGREKGMEKLLMASEGERGKRDCQVSGSGAKN